MDVEKQVGIKLYSTNQFCPECKKEREHLQKVYVKEGKSKDLVCPKHGYQYSLVTNFSHLSWFDDSIPIVGMSGTAKVDDGSIIG